MFSIPFVFVLLFMIADWILDWVILFTIGLVSKKLAYFLIWIVNMVSLPVWLLGGLMRLVTELVTLPIDGWLLLFGNGCFLRWGGNCQFAEGRNGRTKWDLPFYLINPLETQGSVSENIDKRLNAPDLSEFNRKYKLIWGKDKLVKTPDPS